MRFSKTLGAMLVATSFSVLAQIAAPGQAAIASAVQDAAALTSSAVDEAKATLAKVDGALEFPMSDPEKAASQKEVDKAKADLSEHPRTASADEVLELARQARDLARQALDSARNDDRQSALEKFTAARIKLQEARALLASAPAAGQTATASRLQGKVRTNQQLSQAARPQSPAAPTSGLAPASRAATRSGTPGVAARGPAGDRVTIGPSGIHVVDKKGQRVDIGGTAAGQPGIQVFNDGVQLGGGAGLGGIDISEKGISGPGFTITDQGINMGGANIVANRPMGTPGGAGINVYGTGAAAGNGIFIAGHNRSETIQAEGRDVFISGHDHSLTIVGRARAVNVSGHNNNIHVQEAAAINVSGHDNRVSWERGPQGREPGIINSGRANVVVRGNR